MGSAAGQKNALYRGLAAPARLAGTQIDTVLKLEKTFDSIGVNIIGNRGTPKLNCVFQDFAKSEPEPFKLSFCKAASVAARPNAGVEKAFVGIYIANAGKQRLIEQRGFDGGAPATKERSELLGRDCERFRAGRNEG